MALASFAVELPDESERGILVRCRKHGEEEELEPGFRKGSFYCGKCGFELEFTLHDLLEWRDLTERC